MSERDKNRALAEETCQIITQGFYLTAAGDHVDLRASLSRAIQGTREYSDRLALRDAAAVETGIEVWDADTLVAAIQLSTQTDSQVAVLNFASARSPGGGLLRGANAQEESLCRATTLYAALERQKGFYDRNKAWPEEFYSDALLYTPDVMIIRDDYAFLRPDPVSIAVITSPAPNTKALSDRPDGTRLLTSVPAVLARRIDLILGAAAYHGHRSLVLGAWGCGVFGNPPDQVARLFREALAGRFEGQFDTVVFAVAKRFSEENHNAFTSNFMR